MCIECMKYSNNEFCHSENKSQIITAWQKARGIGMKSTNYNYITILTTSKCGNAAKPIATEAEEYEFEDGEAVCNPVIKTF